MLPERFFFHPPGVAAALLVVALLGTGFSFSQHAAQEAAEGAAQVSAQQDEIARLLATPCAETLKNRRIATMVGELHDDGRLQPVAAAGGPLFDEINRRLRRLGLVTLDPEQIQAQIAQAEVTAVLNNDPDAAIRAAGRLQADFFLKGVIEARTRVNPVVKINEVFVTVTMTLTDRGGRPISSVSASGDSYAGQDTMAVTLEILRRQADLLVARLYGDYCNPSTR